MRIPDLGSLQCAASFLFVREPGPHPASPKYGEVKVTCGFKVSIVVFGGGAEGGGGSLYNDKAA
jgi:hypothetical protein